MLDPISNKSDDNAYVPPAVEPTEQERQSSSVVKRLGESAKYTAVFAIMLVAFYLLRKKLADITLDKVVDAISSISPVSFALAIAITLANFVLLTGYDLIAVRYLRKKLPIRRVMMGAVIGYALSNVLGWMFGGTAVRYRLYRRWGFTLVEIMRLSRFSQSPSGWGCSCWLGSLLSRCLCNYRGGC